MLFFGTALGHLIWCNFKIFCVGQPWWPTFYLAPPLPNKASYGPAYEIFV